MGTPTFLAKLDRSMSTQKSRCLRLASHRTEPFPLWDLCQLQVLSVRIELGCRTPRGCVDRESAGEGKAYIFSVTGVVSVSGSECHQKGGEKQI